MKKDELRSVNGSYQQQQPQKVLYQPQQQNNLEKLTRVSSLPLGNNNNSINSQQPLAVLTQQNSNIQTNQSTSLPVLNQPLPPLPIRLNTGPFLSSSVKLLDETFTWQDQFQDVRINFLKTYLFENYEF